MKETFLARILLNNLHTTRTVNVCVEVPRPLVAVTVTLVSPRRKYDPGLGDDISVTVPVLSLAVSTQLGVWELLNSNRTKSSEKTGAA